MNTPHADYNTIGYMKSVPWVDGLTPESHTAKAKIATTTRNAITK